MSYAYRVTVSRSVKETVSARDESRNRISLAGVLSEDRMRELLVQALERKGFGKQADGTWTRTANGVSESFDPESMEVTATTEASGEIRKEKAVLAAGDSRRQRDVAAHRAHAEAEAGARLEKELAVTETERAAKSQELLAEARATLDRTEERRVRDLHEATLEVYAEALKEKAKSLGVVKEMKENRRQNDAGGTEYELIIKVTDD